MIDFVNLYGERKHAERMNAGSSPPISKKVESKKVYNRKKSARLYREDTGRIFSFSVHFRFTLSEILRFSPHPACPYRTSFAASRGSC